MDFKFLAIYQRIVKSPFIISLILFLGVMGPGIITANVCNDAGGITTFSLGGSHIWIQYTVVICSMFHNFSSYSRNGC